MSVSDKPEESTGKPDLFVNLANCGIAAEQAACLRLRLQTFEDDWNRPKMTIYDELLSRDHTARRGDC